MAEWYVHRGSKVRGPFTSGQLKQLVAANQITPTTKVRHRRGNWTPATNVIGLFDSDSLSEDDDRTAEVVIAPVPPRKRRSTIVPVVWRLILLIASFIPVGLVIWKLDEAGLLSQQVRQQEIQQPPRVEEPKREIVQPPPSAFDRQRRTPRQQSAPIDEYKPLPPPIAVEREPVEKPPSQAVTLELEAKVQRVPISLTGDLRVARFDGCAHSIKPPEGSLIEGAVITVNGPRPITIDVEFDDGILVLTPTVRTDAGNSIPYTVVNLRRIQRKVAGNYQDAASQIAAMKSEKQRLETWINAPVAKPLAARGQARAKVQYLSRAIPNAEKVVANIETELAATTELADLAEQLHRGCEIIIECVPDQ